MGLLSEPAFARIDRAVAAGTKTALPLVSYWVGQGVGLMESVKSARESVREFQEDFADALTELSEFAAGPEADSTRTR